MAQTYECSCGALDQHFDCNTAILDALLRFVGACNHDYQVGFDWYARFYQGAVGSVWVNENASGTNPTDPYLYIKGDH